jgi:hypothetical protein
MKLNSNDIENLTSILTIADIADITEVVIEAGKVSGINESKTAVILSEHNIPDLGELKLGLSNLKTLKQRLDLFSTDTTLVVETKENAKNEITQIEMKGKNASVQFRCTSPNLIKYPKSINDDIIKTVLIQREQAQLILNAGRTMGAANIAFSFKKKNEVNVEFTDSNQNKFSIVLTDPYTEIANSTSNVSYFVFSVFAQLLKTALVDAAVNVVEFQIANSSAIMEVNGHPIRMLSQTDG